MCEIILFLVFFYIFIKIQRIFNTYENNILEEPNEHLIDLNRVDGMNENMFGEDAGNEVDDLEDGINEDDDEDDIDIDDDDDFDFDDEEPDIFDSDYASDEENVQIPFDCHEEVWDEPLSLQLCPTCNRPRGDPPIRMYKQIHY